MSKFKHTCKYEQIDEYTFKCSICDKEKMPKELVNDLQRQLAEARETEKKAFWSGFEIARMNPDFNDIQAHWGNHLKLKKHNEQLKEQGE